jgi:hypothetical protein
MIITPYQIAKSNCADDDVVLTAKGVEHYVWSCCKALGGLTFISSYRFGYIDHVLKTKAGNQYWENLKKSIVIFQEAD